MSILSDPETNHHFAKKPISNHLLAWHFARSLDMRFELWLLLDRNIKIVDCRGNNVMSIGMAINQSFCKKDQSTTTLALMHHVASDTVVNQEPLTETTYMDRVVLTNAL